MRIQVKCDNCDWSMHPEELRIDPDGDVTCVDCYAATLQVHRREALDNYRSLPTLPPILAMEPGPPPAETGSYLVQYSEGFALVGYEGRENERWVLKSLSLDHPSFAIAHARLPRREDET